MPEQVAPQSASDAAPAEPAVETPQPTEPQAAVSRPAESASVEPRVAESKSAGAVVPKPRVADPESAGSESTGSESAASRPADPKSVESKSAEPIVPKPRVTAAESTDPDSAEPRSADPESADPESAEPESVEPEVKKFGAMKVLGIVGAILAVAVVAGLKFGVVSAIGNVINKDETAAARAGDCIAKLPEVTGTKQEKVTDARIVGCASTEAVYNVVGRVDDQTQDQARAGTACEQYFKPDEQGYIYSTILPGKTGYVLCLTKKA
ncbi:hypothetical protein AB0C01_27675 [Micromonospora sp. NPDC048905]|uniref:LppU/SCO3897 family protein n=1 Tax=unclassified Micromonospora TaxID=2617518 RepID=UPI003408FDEF